MSFIVTMFVWKVIFSISIWRFVPVLSLALKQSSPGSNLSKTEYSCEHNELHLSCEEGKVIRIIRANYGRLNRDLCNENGKVIWSDEHCVSDRSYPVMTSRCDQKQSCSVLASNTVFGDPCYGTIKYLEVQYMCVSSSNLSKTEYTCEHNELHLSCEEDKVISIIRANYGRLNRDLCNENGKVIWSGGQCISDRSYPVMTARCDQKQSCSALASNTVFGDPCYGTIKYLEVEYMCVSRSNLLKTVLSCEHNELHINCMDGSVIYITKANYGRSNRGVCNEDGQVVWSGGYCESLISYSIMRDRCQEKQNCSILASNTIFGDPCHGTIKYLEVQYVCALPSYIASNPAKSTPSSNSSTSNHDTDSDTMLVDKNLIKTVYSCEHNELRVGCMEGEVIRIIRANYGRLTIDLCNDDNKVVWSREGCISHTSYRIMVDRCEQKQNCSVKASNTVFGDPCYGTIKYLEVQYVCVSSSNFSSGTNKVNNTSTPEISASPDSSLDSTSKVSNTSTPEIGVAPDSSLDSTSKVSNTSTNEIGAAPDSSLDSRLFKTLYSCEHSELRIGCKEGAVIHIIQANYGRLNFDKCNNDGLVEWTGRDCLSAGSYQIMVNRCEKKPSCRVKASNLIFGDPCYGTIKYLEVQYVCVSPSYNAGTTIKPSIFHVSSTSGLDLNPGEGSDSRHLKTEYACKNNMLQIRCMAGKVIFINNAIYGRLNIDVCNDDGKDQWTRQRCTSHGAYTIVTDRCHQKQNCSLEASEEVFGDHPILGNSCSGTNKYLEVQYACVSGSTTENSAISTRPAPLDLDSKSDSTLEIVQKNLNDSDAATAVTLSSASSSTVSEPVVSVNFQNPANSSSLPLNTTTERPKASSTPAASDHDSKPNTTLNTVHESFDNIRKESETENDYDVPVPDLESSPLVSDQKNRKRMIDWLIKNI